MPGSAAGSCGAAGVAPLLAAARPESSGGPLGDLRARPTTGRSPGVRGEAKGDRGGEGCLMST